jgi:tetratricopeptide (TPR) repeat protein
MSAWFDPRTWAKTSSSPGGLSNTAWFWIILGAAFVVRALVLLQLSGNHPAFDQPIVDSRWHYLWAKQIAGGDWLGSEVFYRAPLYPYLLALWMKIFGDGLWPIRLLQAIIGGLTAGLTFLIAQKGFGRRVGLVAGFAAVLYGTLIYYETELLIEVIAVPLGLWAIWLAMEESSQPTPRMSRWLGVGVVIGLFAIARPNILLVVPAFWWWAWPRGAAAGGSFWRKAQAAAVLTAGVLIPIVPVTARNIVVAGDPVLISYQGGINFWLGNNPNADGLTMQMPEVTLDESVEWNEFVSTTDSVASSLAGRTLRPSEISSFWTSRTWDWILSNPGRAIGGWLKKTWYFLSGFEVSDQTDIYAYSTYSLFLNWLISRPLVYIPFGLIAPLGLLGLVLAWRKSPQTRPLVAFIALYAVTVILFLATARHRLPAVPVMTVCAAAAAMQFVAAVRQRALKTILLPALILVALIVALNQRTVERTLSNPAFLHYQMALSFERKGDYEGAIGEYEKALEVEPNHLASRKNLAYALVRVGSYDSAVATSFSYLRHRQDDAEAYNNIGLAYLGQGDTTRAAGSFRTAIKHNPKLPHPYLNLGDIAAARQDNGAAVGYYMQAIQADSAFASAYSALAIIYAGVNNLIMAESLLVTGLKHCPDHAILQANIGALYLKMQRTEEAIPHLERAVFWQPQAVAVRINLAAAYLRQQKFNAAQEHLRQVMAIDPGNATAKLLLDEIAKLGGAQL